MNQGPLVGRSVLLVDDEPIIAADLKSELEGAGASVLCASCAEAEVRVERPFLSVVVLDCFPESHSRRAIIRRLKERRIPFLFYSADPPTSVSTGQGAPWVEKPSPPDDVIAALVLLCGSSTGGPRRNSRDALRRLS